MTVEGVGRLVADIRAAAEQLPSVCGFATAEIERDLRMAAEVLDDALCRLQRARHEGTRSLLDEIEAGNHGMTGVKSK